MTEFRTLNTFAEEQGEGLKEKIDLAMPNDILAIRFNLNPEDPVDDEEFLHATYRAGIQVEKKKALKLAKETAKGGGPGTQPKEGKQDSQGRKNPDSTRKGKGAERTPHPARALQTENRRWYGGGISWGSKEEALKGMPQKEQEEYDQSREDCWRCGCSSHKTYECHTFTTTKGTTLPKAPWKATAMSGQKRQ